MIAWMRSLAFFAGYAVITIIWGALSLLIAWLMPYRARFLFIVGAWTRMILAWLRLTCGIRCQVEGRENIPKQPCIVLARHESTWETLFLQSLFSPQATLIKRELLWIPFFGWAFALLRPIAIDRSEPRKALRRLINQGRERLESGIWVVMFPEGTRMPPGKPGRFQAGGAALASATEAPVVVIAHNAGSYWPAHEFRKQPGTITLRIAPAIETIGKSTKQINDEAARVMAELAPPAAQQK
jgi:1-acyl-sn-glycerol-3-phosphate acyltransferase